jgi:hypothetical protein
LVLVTSEVLKYMMVQSWDVGLGKRAMPQAITFTNYPFAGEFWELRSSVVI